MIFSDLGLILRRLKTPEFDIAELPKTTLHHKVPTLMRRLVPPLLLVAALMAVSLPAAAQTPDQLEFLRNNPELVRQRIQTVGLTPDQIRQRLTAAGYPSNLLDAYLEPNGATAPSPGPLTISALSSLGIPFANAAMALPVDTGTITTPMSAPSSVFGVDVFRRSSTQFLPVLTGPVPSSYVLGPGDVLVLIITGDVEFSYTLPVSREGFIVIPQVGQIYVASLTLAGLRDQLFARLSRAYSGIRRGPGATTQFDVSVANVRANQVFVVGEVQQPGAYQISALGTVLTALYAAGGVTDRANLRDVELRRRDSVVSSFDLYDYLLEGDTHADLRLETGDVVFVGIHGPRVSVSGPVARPGIYELASGDDLRTVIDEAGGFRPEAERRSITIQRILPLNQQGPGPAPRAAVTVALRATPDSGVVPPPFALRDGDEVQVHELPPLEQSLYVGIGGMVREPGRYPWRPDMTLRDLVALAQGTRVGADLREAEIARMPADRQEGQLATRFRVPMDSSYLVLRDSAGRFAGAPGPALAPAGTSPDVRLEPFDQVLILRQQEFEYQRTVSLTGEVRFPGEYALLRKDERMSDLIGRAGGLLPTAYAAGARLFRQLENAGRVNIELQAALDRPGTGADPILQPGDSLFIPEFIATVRVQGAVNSPTSVLYRAGAGFDYYIENAGGFAHDADKGRVSVRYANGDARTPSRFLFWRSYPEPAPGATISVPMEPARPPFDLGQFMGNLAQILASTVAVLVVATRL